MFIPSIHYFRGIAIVTIVIGHCYQIANFPQRFTINFDTNAINILLGLTEKTIGNLISGGTSLFVFISGFLFYHVFYKRFQYARFMHKKAFNVFMPYIILSLPILIQISWGLLRKYDDLSLLGSIKMVVLNSAFYLASGDHLVAYWYIPFAMVLFLASPLFLAFIRIPGRYQLLAIAVLTFFAMLLHRPVETINVLQSFLYFSPVYMFGIYIAIHRERLYRMPSRHHWFFLGGAVLLALVQALIDPKVGSLHKAVWFEFAGFDISLIQKMLLCLTALLFLHRLDERPMIRSLDLLARYSFSIYFFHAYVVEFLETLQFPPFTRYTELIAAIAFGTIVSTVCLGVAWAIKRVVPNHSRMLIGA